MSSLIVRFVGLGLASVASCKDSPPVTEPTAPASVSVSAPVSARAPSQVQGTGATGDASSTPAGERVEARDSDDCSRGLLTEAQLDEGRVGAPTTVARLLTSPPSTGRFTLTAFAEKRHHCPPCLPGALCKPCEDTIWVFESFGTGVKQPFLETADLVVHVPNASPFGHAILRLTVVACPRQDAATKRPLLMLVGYGAPTK